MRRSASGRAFNLLLQAFPVVKLRRTTIRIVHKVANTVGRVMTTGINIANKSSTNALQSQDQPELDARYVYVGVHADGPTRVLCFGETRDEYTRGTNEESVALLTQRLKSLEERNKVCMSQLPFLKWVHLKRRRLASFAGMVLESLLQFVEDHDRGSETVLHGIHACKCLPPLLHRLYSAHVTGFFRINDNL